MDTELPDGKGEMASSRDESFELLYQREYRRVVGTAYLLTRDREEATDLAQETFARALADWRKLATHPAPEAWLQKVITNLSLTWHRRRKRRRAIETSREDVIEPVEGLAPNVMAALQALTESQRVVIVLRYYVDLSVEQVAEIVGKRPGTVKALAFQGLANLRRELQPEGAER